MTFDQLLQQFESSLSQASLLGFAVAALAGVLASAVCPCTLPVGLGVASVSSASRSGLDEGSGTGVRVHGAWIAVSFFAGIVTAMALLATMADRLGLFLTESFGRYWTLGMAVLSLVAAVLAFWGPRLKVDQLAALRQPGVAGAFGYGLVFSFGTSVAPLLLLLTVAAAQSRPGYGLGLGLAFGLGRGLPFLLVGLFAGAVAHLTRLSAWRRGLQIISGGVLLLLSGYFARAFLALL